MVAERISTISEGNPWRRPGDAAVGWLQTILRERFGALIKLQADVNGWQLSLHGNEQVILMDADAAWFARVDSALPIAIWDAQREGWLPVLGKPMPAPGLVKLPRKLIELMPCGYTIHYDILGLTYWMLSRQEEVGRSDLDEHGRFLATSSHALKHGYLERPIVDEWLDILRQVIRRQWPQVELKQHQFKVKVSHDVDTASRYGFCSAGRLVRQMAGDALKRRDFRGAVVAPWIKLNSAAALHPWDPHNTFDWLMDISERRGMASAFYFICDRRGTRHDSNYDLCHPAILRLIHHIHHRGHEIGLHPSYGSYRDPVQIRSEMDRLRAVCAREGIQQSEWGGRMHYLQWEHPTTLRAWNDAGMTYDSTLTYADHAGFRCGTCFEYPAFDPVAKSALNVRVRPLVVMEGSVIGRQYMGLGVTDAARDKVFELRNACEAVNGCFTLLWHNSSLTTNTQRRIYEAVVSG